MEESQKEACTHEKDSERGWHCVLNSVDIEEGLRSGGRIVRVYEVWDWSRSQCRSDLFTTMITSLIGKKVTSKPGVEKLSGEERDEITRAWAELGVDLQKYEWRGNVNTYTYAKIFLNSVSIKNVLTFDINNYGEKLWGRMALKAGGVLKTRYVRNWEELEKVMGSGERIELVRRTGDEAVMVQSRTGKEEECEPSNFANLFISG